MDNENKSKLLEELNNILSGSSIGYKERRHAQMKEQALKSVDPYKTDEERKKIQDAFNSLHEIVYHKSGVDWMAAYIVLVLLITQDMKSIAIDTGVCSCKSCLMENCAHLFNAVLSSFNPEVKKAELNANH